MLELIQNLSAIVDAPIGAVLACPAGVVATLHFASATTPEIKGARCDIVVIQAKAAAIQRPRWIKILGVSLGVGVAGASFIHLQDPNFWTTVLSALIF